MLLNEPDEIITASNYLSVCLCFSCSTLLKILPKYSFGDVTIFCYQQKDLKKLRPTCIALHWWSPQLYSYYSYSIYQTLTNRITRGASEGGRGDAHDMQTMLYTGLFPTRYFVSQYLCKLFLPFFNSPWHGYTHYLHLSQYIQS